VTWFSEVAPQIAVMTPMIIVFLKKLTEESGDLLRLKLIAVFWVLE
jgi:hypothetical protein